MAGTAFLRDGFELVVENGERKVKPKRPETWKHRTDGHQAAKKAWLCRACWTMHFTKPGICDNGDCERTHFECCDSRGEAQWLVGLVHRLTRGEITGLVLHPVYRLHALGPAGPVHVASYTADAEYIEKGGVIITADWKPRLNRNAPTKAKREAMLDPRFKLVRRFFEAEYGRPITLVTAG